MNPVEQLYGEYHPFDHAKAQVLDPELNMYQPLDYVVPAGPSNRVYDTVQSSTQTSTQTQSFIRQMTLEDLTSSWMTFRASVSLQFPPAWGGVAKSVLSTYLEDGNLFAGQWPLQQASTNVQAIIAGTTISLDTSTLASVLLKGYRHLGSNPYIQAWPSAPDTSATFTSWAAPSLSGPNVPPFALPPKVQTRNLNAFNTSFIENSPPDVNCQGLVFTWEEVPLIDLFSLVRDGKAAFSGLNQIQFILTFAAPASKVSDGANVGQPLERVFSGVPAAPLVTLVGGPYTLRQVLSQSTITFADIPEMHFIQYSQNLSFPLYNMYSRPYLDFNTGFQSQNISNVVIPQITLSGSQPQVSFTANMNSQTLLQIPKMFVLWTGYQSNYRRAWDASWCGVPQKIAIRFAGSANLLASATPLELFELSVKNGLNMTWYEAQQCGYPLMLLPSDLGLSAGALILEGVTGSFQIQVTSFECLTPAGLDSSAAPLTLTNLQLQMVPVYSMEFQINNNRANVIEVAGMDANQATSIPFVDSDNSEVQTLLSGGSIMSRIKAGYRALVQGLKSRVRPLVEEVGSAVMKGSGASVRSIRYR